MIRQILRGAIGIAFAVMLQAAFAGKSDIPEYRPPQIVQRPDNFNGCHARAAVGPDTDSEQSARLTIAADGSVSKSSMGDSAPGWMQILSDCVVGQLKFSAATKNGDPVEQRVSLSMRFRALEPDEGTGVTVEKVGPVITPPRILVSSDVVEDCLRHRKLDAASIDRIQITLTVQPDGKATDVIYPVGSEAWHEKVAQCVLERAHFAPGTRDGLPVTAQGTMPITIQEEQGEVTYPKLRSTAQVVEAAFRTCYPPGLASSASAFYSFTVATDGRVGNPKLVKTSGDTRLDEAGACIVQMLEFSPLMQYGRAMRSTVTWELPIRPPR